MIFFEVALKYMADLSHAVSFLLLIYTIKSRGHCIGLSYRTQELFLVAFLLRYSAAYSISSSRHMSALLLLCNNLFRVFYLGSAVVVIYLLRREKSLKSARSKKADNFPHRISFYPSKLSPLSDMTNFKHFFCSFLLFLKFFLNILVCFLVGFFLTKAMILRIYPYGSLIVISYVLETVGFAPQLWMLKNLARAEGGSKTVLDLYVLFLWIYKALYTIES